MILARFPCIFHPQLFLFRSFWAATPKGTMTYGITFFARSSVNLRFLHVISLIDSLYFHGNWIACTVICFRWRDSVFSLGNFFYKLSFSFITMKSSEPRSFLPVKAPRATRSGYYKDGL